MSDKNKILVVSNECFSNNSSNGRTLKNMLQKIEKKNLAQFYLHGNPDFTFCEDYFCVSDQKALKSFLHSNKKTSDKKKEVKRKNIKYKTNLKITKNCRNLFLRNVIWKSYCWWDIDFDSFLERIHPDIVMLQAGDMPVMFDISCKIANKYGSALIMYNSEGYILKDKLYNGVKNEQVWHYLLKKSLEKSYTKFMKRVDYCIYSTEYLERKYQEKYPSISRSTTVYTVSEMLPLKDNSSQEKFELLYCGNLGVGRAETLDRIAKVLYKVDSSAILHICGKFVSEPDKNLVTGNKNVLYEGVVSYEEVPMLMAKANVVLHCENSSRVENLKYAFSTKIADCLASGRPFLVYADRQYPFVQYLKEHDCCHIACNENELYLILNKCKNDIVYRMKFTEKAIELAHKNHNGYITGIKVKSIIDELVAEKAKGALKC